MLAVLLYFLFDLGVLTLLQPQPTITKIEFHSTNTSAALNPNWLIFFSNDKKTCLQNMKYWVCEIKGERCFWKHFRSKANSEQDHVSYLLITAWFYSSISFWIVEPSFSQHINSVVATSSSFFIALPLMPQFHQICVRAGSASSQLHHGSGAHGFHSSLCFNFHGSTALRICFVLALFWRMPEPRWSNSA